MNSNQSPLAYLLVNSYPIIAHNSKLARVLNLAILFVRQYFYPGSKIFQGERSLAGQNKIGALKL